MVVKEEVIKTIEVPGETVVKEVVKEVAGAGTRKFERSPNSRGYRARQRVVLNGQLREGGSDYRARMVTRPLDCCSSDTASSGSSGCPSSGGIEPDSWLSVRYSSSKSGRLPSSRGIPPVSVL